MNLNQYLLDNRNQNGVPILNEQQWSDINAQFDKETIVAALIDIIVKTKPPCPLRDISFADMQKSFWDLCLSDLKSTFQQHDEVKDLVLEKFEDGWNEDTGRAFPSSYLLIRIWPPQRLKL